MPEGLAAPPRATHFSFDMRCKLDGFLCAINGFGGLKDCQLQVEAARVVSSLLSALEAHEILVKKRQLREVQLAGSAKLAKLYGSMGKESEEREMARLVAEGKNEEMQDIAMREKALQLYEQFEEIAVAALAKDPCAVHVASKVANGVSKRSRSMSSESDELEGPQAKRSRSASDCEEDVKPSASKSDLEEEDGEESGLRFKNLFEKMVLSPDDSSGLVTYVPGKDPPAAFHVEVRKGCGISSDIVMDGVVTTYNLRRKKSVSSNSYQKSYWNLEDIIWAEGSDPRLPNRLLGTAFFRGECRHSLEFAWKAKKISK